MPRQDACLRSDDVDTRCTKSLASLALDPKRGAL